MYRCGNCGGSFERFEVPGQCPLCKKWAAVQCSACGHTAIAKVFVDAGNRCPKCGSVVVVEGQRPARQSPAKAGSAKPGAGHLGCALVALMLAVGSGVGIVFVPNLVALVPDDFAHVRYVFYGLFGLLGIVSAVGALSFGLSAVESLARRSRAPRPGP